MAEWVLPALWLGLFGASWRFLPKYGGRTLMLSLLVLIGHLIAAGLASHRSNPLHSFDGSFRSILILEIAAVMLAPLACARTLPDTKPLNRWHTLPVLLYAALTVLASFFGYARYIQAINFSLKWAHLKAPAAGVLLTLLTASALVSVLLALHLIEAARRKQLYGYAGALLSAVGGIALVSLLLAPRYYLHIHHSVWSLFLVFLFRYEKWWSRYAQALALGIYIDGLASWGLSSIWHLTS